MGGGEAGEGHGEREGEVGPGPSRWCPSKRRLTRPINPAPSEWGSAGSKVFRLPPLRPSLQMRRSRALSSRSEVLSLE